MSELRTPRLPATPAHACLRRSPPPATSGFTLIELLVVIAIIGCLVALLLPAVQAARESARRTQCMNNLFQMGVAMTLHVDAHGQFPIGCIGHQYIPPAEAGGEPIPAKFISWNVQLLPYLELPELWSAFDFSLPALDPNNKAVGVTVVETFLCPSTRESELRSTLYEWKGTAFTDYGGVYGVEGPGHDAPFGESQLINKTSLGVLIYDQSIAPHDVTDGLSKTASIAELASRRQPDVVWINGNNLVAQNESTPINAVGLTDEIGSPHPGGAFLAFCDGHVRFVAESIDQSTLLAMLTKAGGD
jgi:prepilin-type N-terminal cleavage/methylation domain-containing protein/prepilin-type processing-associated H-X9-DG protein